MEFTRELCRMQEYCYFCRKCCHHRRSSMTYKNFCSQHSQEVFSEVSVFSIAVGNRLGRTNYLKRTHVKQLERLKSISTENCFLGMFQNFQKRSFSEHPLKKYNVGVFQRRNSIPVTLLNGFMIHCFLATFQNSNRKYFAWIPFLLKSDILDLNLQKRMFSIIFSKFENILFFLSNFKKVFVVGVLVRQQSVDCSRAI